MRDVIEMIVRALVDDSESKQGRTIRALRSLARIAGVKKNRRYLLEIVE
jgi:predicted RNA-binding protein YlqC (UPF0109 family)